MSKKVEKLHHEALTHASKKMPSDMWFGDIFYGVVAGKFAGLIVEKCVNSVPLDMSQEDYIRVVNSIKSAFED